jgi:hypothetical protein
METQPTLHSTGASSSLGSVAFGNKCFHKAAYLSLLIKSNKYVRKANGMICKTNLISRYFPVSITQVMSGIVIPVSAMFVAEGEGMKIMSE